MMTRTKILTSRQSGKLSNDKASDMILSDEIVKNSLVYSCSSQPDVEDTISTDL